MPVSVVVVAIAVVAILSLPCTFNLFVVMVAMFVARDITGSSLNIIGKHFGNRDHSTVIHSCKTIEDKLNQDEHLKKTIKEIKNQLQ